MKISRGRCWKSVCRRYGQSDLVKYTIPPGGFLEGFEVELPADIPATDSRVLMELSMRLTIDGVVYDTGEVRAVYRQTDFR